MPFFLWLQIWHHMKAKVHMDMYDIAIGYLHLCVKGDSTDVKEVLTLIQLTLIRNNHPPDHQLSALALIFMGN